MARLEIPVIGIGAGAATDGQVLVFHDLLGIYDGHVARFAKRYADVRAHMVAGRGRVRRRGPQRRFPAPEHWYSIDDEELARFRAGLTDDCHGSDPRRPGGSLGSGGHAPLHPGVRPARPRLLRAVRGGRPEHAARLLAALRAAAHLSGQQATGRGDPRPRARGRPDHPRHHRSAQPDVRDADRPRGHPRARLGARRHRRLHRGGRRLPRAVQDRGADGAVDPAGARAQGRLRPRSPRRSASCTGSATSRATRSRSTGWRTRATGSPARRSPRCSTAGSTRWW